MISEPVLDLDINSVNNYPVWFVNIAVLATPPTCAGLSNDPYDGPVLAHSPFDVEVSGSYPAAALIINGVQ